MIKIKFAGSDCGACQHLADCTRGKRARRSLTLRAHEQHIALMGARRRETTAEFTVLSAVRAGVDCTMSQAVRGFGMRRSRYVRLAKTHLQHVAPAVAVNLVRMTEWLGSADRAKTRRSKFGTPMAQAAWREFASGIEFAESPRLGRRSTTEFASGRKHDQT